MELKTLTGEQIKMLRAPLPKEAIKPHPTKTYLSTIKAIYVVERLNDVFGIGKWSIRGEKVIESGEKMVVVESRFIAPEYGIELWAFGGNDNVDRGDAFKGAVTDALTKIGSYLEIGMDVFKGFGDKAEPKPGHVDTPSEKQLEQYHAFVSDIKDAKTVADLKNVYAGASESLKVNLILKSQLAQIKDLCTAKKEELNRG